MLRLKAPIARVGRRRRLLASNRHRSAVEPQHLESRLLFSSNAPQQQQQQQKQQQKQHDLDDQEMLLSAKEMHEQRVGQVQAAARERRQQQESLEQQTQLLRKTQKLESEKRHSISNSIQHWLAKDASFFQSTMIALNLNSQWTNQDQDEESVKEVLNQYRHLYYDSIPSFRIQLENNPPEALTHAISQLDTVGFSDQKWSKRYRQVKGLLFQQENFMRRLSKQKRETIRRQQILKTAERDLRELQELEHLTNRVREKKQTAKALAEELSSVSKQQQQPPLLHQLYNFVSSMIFSPPQQQQPNGHQDEVIPTIPQKPRDSRLQKRIKRKQIGVSNVRHDAKAAKQKLKLIEQEVQRFSLPIPQEQYHRANEVVVEVRDEICQELAQHVQQRHAQLIEQYQALDAKTGKWNVRIYEWCCVVLCCVGLADWKGSLTTLRFSFAMMYAQI
jgi:hypothetical protein